MLEPHQYRCSPCHERPPPPTINNKCSTIGISQWLRNWGRRRTDSGQKHQRYFTEEANDIKRQTIRNRNVQLFCMVSRTIELSTQLLALQFKHILAGVICVCGLSDRDEWAYDQYLAICGKGTNKRNDMDTRRKKMCHSACWYIFSNPHEKHLH